MTDTEQPESLPSASNASPADGEAAPPADGAAHGTQRTSGAGCKILLVLALIGGAVLGIMLGVTQGHLADAREAGKNLTLNLNASSKEVSRLKRELEDRKSALADAESKLYEVERLIRQSQLGLTSIPINVSTQLGSRVVFDHEDLVRKYNGLVNDYNDLGRRYNDCVIQSQELEHLVDMIAKKVRR